MSALPLVVGSSVSSKTGEAGRSASITDALLTDHAGFEQLSGSSNAGVRAGVQSFEKFASYLDRYEQELHSQSTTTPAASTRNPLLSNPFPQTQTTVGSPENSAGGEPNLSDEAPSDEADDGTAGLTSDKSAVTSTNSNATKNHPLPSELHVYLPSRANVNRIPTSASAKGQQINSSPAAALGVELVARVVIKIHAETITSSSSAGSSSSNDLAAVSGLVRQTFDFEAIAETRWNLASPDVASTCDLAACDGSSSPAQQLLQDVVALFQRLLVADSLNSADPSRLSGVLNSNDLLAVQSTTAQPAATDSQPPATLVKRPSLGSSIELPANSAAVATLRDIVRGNTATALPASSKADASKLTLPDFELPPAVIWFDKLTGYGKPRQTNSLSQLLTTRGQSLDADSLNSPNTLWQLLSATQPFALPNITSSSKSNGTSSSDFDWLFSPLKLPAGFEAGLSQSSDSDLDWTSSKLLEAASILGQLFNSSPQFSQSPTRPDFELQFDRVANIVAQVVTKARTKIQQALGSPENSTAPNSPLASVLATNNLPGATTAAQSVAAEMPVAVDATSTSAEPALETSCEIETSAAPARDIATAPAAPQSANIETPLTSVNQPRSHAPIENLPSLDTTTATISVPSAVRATNDFESLAADLRVVELTVTVSRDSISNHVERVTTSSDQAVVNEAKQSVTAATGESQLRASDALRFSPTPAEFSAAKELGVLTSAAFPRRSRELFSRNFVSTNQAIASYVSNANLPTNQTSPTNASDLATSRVATFAPFQKSADSLSADERPLFAEQFTSTSDANIELPHAFDEALATLETSLFNLDTAPSWLDNAPPVASPSSTQFLDAQFAATLQSSSTRQTPASSTTANRLVSKLTHEISDWASSSQERKKSTIQIRLDPPELGPMRIHMLEREGQLSLRMIVADETAQHLVMEQMNQLRQSLEQNGVIVQNFDVERQTAFLGGSEWGARHPSRQPQTEETPRARKAKGDVEEKTSSLLEDSVNYLI